MKIPLHSKTVKLLSVSGKESRHYQLKIRYGAHFQTVTLRAPTSAIYETWWAALETALSSPNYVALPVIDARAGQVTIAPVVPTRPNILRPKYTMALDTVVEENLEDESVGIPMLEEGGPSSPTEIDILASWRTWGSLDYFATPQSIADPLSSDSDLEAAVDDVNIKNDNSNTDRVSVYSDISEFWSRPSQWEDENNPTQATHFTKSPPPQKQMTQQPQGDDDKWLDEIALYAFRQKVGASRESERRPSRRISERLHPLLKYALF
ncbi:hypothetical protein P3T76_012889 [Phytophthora citrophthora]|uniref:PH domain-containing protein n=1 Tax=Phytophthora citrophthora TaxID=4793 RepID=A0AAD9G4K8_9STRA|nr:hypothetical protein P3T76_012889 [Phytophthora citrophthora]